MTTGDRMVSDAEEQHAQAIVEHQAIITRSGGSGPQIASG